ncbi:MAG: TatD family hydrolase [Abditibacteriota bacterium]|nr:TatD family hydrolase [Abditibacteriota bacterium]
MTDTHAHLNDERFAGDLADTIARAAEKGVGSILVCGWDIPSGRQAADMAAAYPSVYAAAGVHPHDSESWSPEAAEDIRELSAKGRIVAVGEIGLDYYYDLEFRESQLVCFREQLKLSLELDLPVSIHSRCAMEDTIGALREYPGVRGVLHCFSGTMEQMSDLLDMGLYIGAAGPVTFKSSEDLRSVIRYVPADRLLLETDCPYMAPAPLRGRRNEPWMVCHVLEKMAGLLNMEPADLEALTDDNARRLFGLRG